jgi:hypothetical protein
MRTLLWLRLLRRTLPERLNQVIVYFLHVQDVTWLAPKIPAKQRHIVKRHLANGVVRESGDGTETGTAITAQATEAQRPAFFGCAFGNEDAQAASYNSHTDAYTAPHQNAQTCSLCIL